MNEEKCVRMLQLIWHWRMKYEVIEMNGSSIIVWKLFWPWVKQHLGPLLFAPCVIVGVWSMTMTEKYAVINFRRCLRCNIRNYINRAVSLENNDAVINIGGKRHWSQHKTTWPCITSPRERFSLMCEIEIEDQAKNV